MQVQKSYQRMKSVPFARFYGTPSEEPKGGEVVGEGSSEDPRLKRDSLYDFAASAMERLRGGAESKGSDAEADA